MVPFGLGQTKPHHFLGDKVRRSDPQRLAFYLTSRGITNEVYYVAQKVARFLGTNHIDNAARLCHSPSTGAMKHVLGVAATTCSYEDWYGSDLIVPPVASTYRFNLDLSSASGRE